MRGQRSRQAAEWPEIARCDPGGKDLQGSLPTLATLDAVRAYQADAANGKLLYDLRQCPRCGAAPRTPEFFRSHSVRNRRLLVIAARLVYEVVVPLVRFRCSKCRRTFTRYPPFILPHKRYALPEMCSFVRRYLEDGCLSYRRGVTESRLPIFHTDPGMAGSGSSERVKKREITRILSHTTLFRWITSLGTTLPPSSARNGSDVSPRKAQTPARLRLLSTCLKLCRLWTKT